MFGRSLGNEPRSPAIGQKEMPQYAISIVNVTGICSHARYQPADAPDKARGYSPDGGRVGENSPGASNRHDQIHLDANVPGQPRSFHGGARGRILRKIPSINFVHRSEITHVLQVDGGFYGA